jgi:hypothetical protein
VVTSVDSGGTESVQSLAVKPASAVTSSGSGGGGAAVPACFIRAAGHPAMQPYLMIGLILTVVAALFAWRSRRMRNGSYNQS